VWTAGWRERLWDELAARREPWDVVVAGGGIAGAGLFREATRCGLATLLLEGRDFAWGTSSRSSKLVHGGIRYLQHGHFRLTRESLRERDRLLREAPGLVEPLLFLRPIYAWERSRWIYPAAFAAYGLLAGRRQHTYHAAAELVRRAPGVSGEGLLGAYGYMEAGVDDARLVLRLLREGVRAGGRALSYAPVESLLLDRGTVAGVRARDAEGGPSLGDVGGRRLIRPLRGSHIVFSAGRLPLPQALSFRHPADGRHVFLAPWEGASIVGTTDCDHDAPPDVAPRITPAERDYLLEAVTALMPALRIRASDVQATWAGVRPVVGHANTDPSSESREGLLVDEQGLVTVTGGKLTTVRSTALAALARVGRRVELPRPTARGGRLFDDGGEALDHLALAPAWRHRLRGHYGGEAAAVVAGAAEAELEVVPATRTLWAQLRWAARSEGITHLDDLLLRRTRLGMVLPGGGVEVLPRVRVICQPELGWSDERWRSEEDAYRGLWASAHAPSPPAQAPFK
jgi:glycerol-3-phosphate dehydrogenase